MISNVCTMGTILHHHPFLIMPMKPSSIYVHIFSPAAIATKPSRKPSWVQENQHITKPYEPNNFTKQRTIESARKKGERRRRRTHMQEIYAQWVEKQVLEEWMMRIWEDTPWDSNKNSVNLILVLSNKDKIEIHIRENQWVAPKEEKKIKECCLKWFNHPYIWQPTLVWRIKMLQGQLVKKKPEKTE